MVDAINDNIQSIAFILTIVAATLLFISFALINNTVRLTVFSRRFTIHTMKLVGASASFIRKPFVLSNITSGIVAGLIADVILAGALFYFHSADPAVAIAVPWELAGLVFTGIVLLGMIICALAATIATNKYLRLSYDDMFK
jgi:cell division transport system permease protein